MPTALLIAQALIVTLFSIAFVIMPTVSSAYWILNATLAQLYLIMYILMFAAVIKLRYKRPRIERAYKIPGGIVGVWIVAGLGLIGSVATFIIGFFPPAQIATGNTFTYVAFLVISIVLACIAPSIILFFKKSNWRHE
jgi:amino acid transporter